MNIDYELPFKEPEFKEKWLEWIEYRKERRLPSYKPIGLKKTLNALFRDSGGNVTEAMDMLEYSMEKYWQGIFKRPANGTIQNQHSLKNPVLRKSEGAEQLVDLLKTKLSDIGRTGT